MRYFLGINSLFLSALFCTRVLAAEPSCPKLDLPPSWTLENKVIHFQDHKWYVSKFWHTIHETTGNDFLDEISFTELKDAQKIEFSEQIDSRTCCYNVIRQNSKPAQLIIKLFGK